LNLILNEAFDDTSYTKWDFIELILFNEKYKSWKLKYTWYIYWISRKFNIVDWQEIELKVNWIISLLSEYSISKTYSWTLNSVVNQFIIDFHWQKNTANALDYFWTNILKNWLISPTWSVNVTVNWTFLDALNSIFTWKDYFLSKDWSIINTDWITQEQIYTVNTNISNISIDTDNEIDLSLSGVDIDVEVWHKIYIQNINSSLNLEWLRIKELAFWLEQVDVSLWQIKYYKDVI